MKKVDYIIVGQGIAGSILAHELLKADKKVVLINKTEAKSSSRVAAGLYNPITGRKMVKTWMADVLFERLSDYYDQLDDKFSIKSHHALPIYRPFSNIEEQNDWAGSASEPEYKMFVSQVYTKSRGIDGVIDPYGGIELKNCGYVDLPLLLDNFKEYFESKGLYYEELLDENKMEIEDDSVKYGKIEANKILFCQGTLSTENPFFSDLKFRPVKGEIIDIKTSFDERIILNRGVFIMPKKGYYRVGSTYDNHDMTLSNTQKGINTLKDKLAKIFTADYEIIDMKVGIRPATFDRRPFIGLHPDHQQIGIFNGFGTKGVSLVPFFAKLFVQFLIEGKELVSEVSITR